MADDGNTETGDLELGPDLSGQRLGGRYRIAQVLGRGGMGAVYLAEDEQFLGRKVVIKVPHGELLAEAGFRRRFQAEIQSLVRLEHPHIVKVLDGGVHEGTPYAVLQYLAGGSLLDRLDARGGLVPPDDVLEWLPSIAEALDFIHRKGYVHRDLKPANILFDGDGHAFLADFGIAKALEGRDPGVTQAGRIVGSPQYMAPEVIRGDAHALGPAYDQYSLAVVVYEALCGQRPHEADSSVGLLMQKLSRAPRPLRAVAPMLPIELEQALMRALSPDPKARYASCAELARAAEPALRRTAASPTASHTLPRLSTPAAAAPAATETFAADPVFPPSEFRASPSERPLRLRLDLVLGGLALAAVFAIPAFRPAPAPRGPAPSEAAPPVAAHQTPALELERRRLLDRLAETRAWLEALDKLTAGKRELVVLLDELQKLSVPNVAIQSISHWDAAVRLRGSTVTLGAASELAESLKASRYFSGLNYRKSVVPLAGGRQRFDFEIQLRFLPPPGASLAPSPLPEDDSVALARRVHALEQQVEQTLARLPRKPQVDAIAQRVEALAVRAGLDLESFEYRRELVSRYHGVQPVRLVLRGAYTELRNFAAEVADEPSVVHLKGLEMQVRPDAPQPGSMHIALMAEVYWFQPPAGSGR